MGFIAILKNYTFIDIWMSMEFVISANFIAHSFLLVKDFPVRIVKHFPGLFVCDIYEFGLHFIITEFKDGAMSE